MVQSVDPINYFERIVYQDAIDISATGDVITAVAGKTIAVVSYMIVCAGAVTVKWVSSSAAGTADDTALSGAMSFAANGGGSASGPPYVMVCSDGEALGVILGGAVNVAGHISYHLI